MKFLSRRLQVRDEVSILDTLHCFELARLAKASELKGNKKAARHYLKRIVEKLTTVKKARTFDLLKLDEVLKAAGLMSPDNAASKERKKTAKNLKKFGAWLSAQLGISYLEAMSGNTRETLPEVVKAILLRNIEERIAHIRAQHSPIKYHKELISELKKLKKGDYKAVKKPEQKKFASEAVKVPEKGSFRPFALATMEPC